MAKKLKALLVGARPDDNDFCYGALKLKYAALYRRLLVKRYAAKGKKVVFA